MSPAAAAQTAPPLRLGQQIHRILVRDLSKSFSGAQGIFVIQVGRVATRELNQLRRTLQPLESSFSVVKNNLGKIAFKGFGWEEVSHLLKGTCGISPIRTDVGALAKVLAEFAKGHEGFLIQGGILEGQVLAAQDVKSLAKLPSRQVLLSQLAGVAIHPLRSLAFLLQAPLRSFVSVLQAVTRKKQ